MFCKFIIADMISLQKQRVKKIEKIRGRPNAYCTVLYRMLTEEEMPLDIRRWTCPGCETIHDRDVNAARNILKVGGIHLGGRGRKSCYRRLAPLITESRWL